MEAFPFPHHAIRGGVAVTTIAGMADLYQSLMLKELGAPQDKFPQWVYLIWQLTDNAFTVRLEGYVNAIDLEHNREGYTHYVAAYPYLTGDADNPGVLDWLFAQGCKPLEYAERLSGAMKWSLWTPEWSNMLVDSSLHGLISLHLELRCREHGIDCIALWKQVAGA